MVKSNPGRCAVHFHEINSFDVLPCDRLFFFFFVEKHNVVRLQVGNKKNLSLIL